MAEKKQRTKPSKPVKVGSATTARFWNVTVRD
jgi:hypothetical protein